MPVKNSLAVGNISEAMQFADRHLGEYHVRGEKIVPQYCPICNGGENKDVGTFAIYPDENGRFVYKCLRASCPEAKGTLHSLMKMFGEEGMKSTGVSEFTSKMQRKVYRLPPVSNFKPPTEKIYEYFEARKISRVTVDAFHIMTNDDENIVFPFYEGNDIVFVKYRRPKKYHKGDGMKEWREEKTKSILFGINMTSYSEELIVTEGQLDCMALYEAGVRNVVSVPSGAQDETWIDNCWEALKKYPSICLFGDNDGVGLSAVDDWANRLDKTRCRIVEDYPPVPDKDVFCKDANEILYYYGAEKLREMILSAKSTEMPGLIDISTVAMFAPTKSKLILSSLYTINYELGGYSPGDLVCWTGKTGAGKSTVVSQEVLSAINDGEKAVWYTGELSPSKLKRNIILQCATSDYIGLEYDARRDRDIPTVSMDIAQRINEWIAGRIMLCDDNVATMDFNSAYLIELLKYARRRNGCTVAVVDNIMMAVMSADDDQYYRAQEKFTLSLKQVAMSMGMVIHLVAHPRKTRENITNDDISGSASITRLADTVMSVEHGKINVLKDRNEGNINIDAKFIYYPDSKLCVDQRSLTIPEFGWNRDGVVKPTPLASTKYREIIPDIGEYAV